MMYTAVVYYCLTTLQLCQFIRIHTVLLALVYSSSLWFICVLRLVTGGACRRKLAWEGREKYLLPAWFGGYRLVWTASSQML
jgi:hypothetical protein